MSQPHDAAHPDAAVAALCELMSAVSHDLRTPLTPIKGYAEIIRSRPGLAPERIEQYAGTIVLAAARMEHDIDLLSALAALYRGRADLRSENVAVATLIDERLERWRGHQPARQFTADADDTVVVADPKWLARVVDELVEHAVRTSTDTDAVTIRSTRSDDGARATFTATTETEPRDEGGSAVGRLTMSFIAAVSEVCGFTVPTESLAVEVPIA